MFSNTRLLALIGVIFLSISALLGDVQADDDWGIEKSAHFIVYYQKAMSEYNTPALNNLSLRGSDSDRSNLKNGIASPLARNDNNYVHISYIREVISKAEYYYNKIIEGLGFRRFDFWTWDKRCLIYLYSNKDEYIRRTGSAPWSRAGVHVIKKEIYSYIEAEGFFDYVLPHEMGHIIFREAVGFDKALPLWIDEAIASMQEKDRVTNKVNSSGGITIPLNRRYVSLEELSRVSNYSTIEPSIFYIEAVSVMEFLLRKFGTEKFIEFCRKIRDGDDWREGLLKTYSFGSLEELEEEWIVAVGLISH